MRYHAHRDPLGTWIEYGIGLAKRRASNTVNFTGCVRNSLAFSECTPHLSIPKMVAPVVAE